MICGFARYAIFALRDRIGWQCLTIEKSMLTRASILNRLKSNEVWFYSNTQPLFWVISIPTDRISSIDSVTYVYESDASKLKRHNRTAILDHLACLGRVKKKVQFLKKRLKTDLNADTRIVKWNSIHNRFRMNSKMFQNVVTPTLIKVIVLFVF